MTTTTFFGLIYVPLSDGNQSLLSFETETKFDFAIFILSNNYINNTLFIPNKKNCQHLEKMNEFIWASDFIDE